MGRSRKAMGSSNTIAGEELYVLSQQNPSLYEK